MPPRTRRGVPRGGGAAAPAAGASTSDDAPAAASRSAPATAKPETPQPPPQSATATADTESAAATSTLQPPSTTATATPATVTSAPAPATGAAPAPLLPSQRAAAARGRASLKPKIVRRTEEERRALAEQEEKKLHARAAEEERRRRAENRGRGRGRGAGFRGGRGRGRGDFGGGRDGLIRRTVQPDGPFAQMPGSVSQGRGGARSAGGFGSGSGGGGGGGGLGSGRGSGGAAAGGNFSTVSGRAEEHDPRLNTDLFNGRAAGYSDDASVKDEHAAGPTAAAAAGSAKTKKAQQLLPMGIKREEHREPEVVVATTAELEAAGQDGGVSVEDSSDSDLFTPVTAAGSGAGAAATAEDDNEVWSRAIRTNKGVRLVGADGQEIEVTDIDTLAEKRQEIAAAARHVKQEADDDGGQPSLDSISAQPSIATSSKARKKKAKPQATAPKDPEDVAIEQGLQAMLHDLAVDPPRDGTHVSVPSTESSGEQAAEQQQQQQQPRREGRLFLFQFPPVLPALQAFQPNKSENHRGGTAGGGGADGRVKREPGVDDDDDLVMLDSVAEAAAPIDLTDSGGTLPDRGKEEDGPSSDIGSGGFLGTLSIRRSGRAELSWGGMTYQMMPGTDVQFLTTAVLLEDSDEKRKPGEAGAAMVGNAFGMGPVGGKYNLVPVFSDETEWVVDPAELAVDEDMEG